MPHRVDAEPRFEERAARLEWRIDTTDRRLRELQERLERLKATSEVLLDWTRAELARGRRAGLRLLD
jgi:hypothetical protein